MRTKLQNKDVFRTRSELNSSQTNLYWTKAVCEQTEIDLNGKYSYLDLESDDYSRFYPLY